MVFDTLTENSVNSDSSLFVNAQYVSYDSIKRGTINGSYERDPTIKLYKSRFFMMMLYGTCTFLNAFQWIQFSIIASIVKCYYNVGIQAVNWTSNIFSLMYVPFIFPAMWMMDKKGLKMTLVVAAAGNTLGAAIQCLSIAPDRFYVVVLSQAVSATSQTFSVSVPSLIAALWFGSKEVSFACAFAIMLNQFGNAVGFLVPPLLVTNDCNDKKAIESGLSYLAVGMTVANFISFMLIVLFFKDKPISPPSIAQVKKDDEVISTFKWIKIMVRNKAFCLLAISSGLLLSVAYAIATMLNQMVVRIFPGKEVDAGWIGLLTVFAGIAGNLLFGHILDRTKKFKKLSLVVYAVAFLSMVFYTLFSPRRILWLHYLMFISVGFFMNGFLAIAFEYSAEITYPGPEGISGTLMYTSPQVLGIIATMAGSWLQQNWSDLSSNVFFCGVIVLGSILLVFVKGETTRSKLESVPETKSV